MAPHTMAATSGCDWVKKPIAAKNGDSDSFRAFNPAADLRSSGRFRENALCSSISVMSCSAEEHFVNNLRSRG